MTSTEQKEYSLSIKKQQIVTLLLSFRQDRTNIIIVLEPVGHIGKWKNPAVAVAGLKAVGSSAVNRF